jgi:hypothetical protein
MLDSSGLFGYIESYDLLWNLIFSAYKLLTDFLEGVQHENQVD